LMSQELEYSFADLSIHSAGSNIEDWDRSLTFSDNEPPSPNPNSHIPSLCTPRNSVVFPVDDSDTPRRRGSHLGGGRASFGASGKRSLSELLRVHAAKGTDCNFSAEEAARVADVLRQWINAASSPYEGEDDFFARSHDDLSIPSKRAPNSPLDGRPRGQSESANSRPPSSAGFAQS
ncbi:hypothetical protein BD779DRAFT_1446557, partial [Infundibulicybe gibba]